MALSDIVDRILADAREEAGRIREAGEDGARAVLAEAERTAAARREELVASASQELIAGKRNRLAGVRLEARKRVLAVRRELLAELFAEVERDIAARETTEYAAFLAGLLPEEAPSGPLALSVGHADLERHGAAFAGALEAALGRERPAWSLTVDAEPGAFDAGIQVRGERSIIDLSLETLLAERRERWELAVGKALFAP